MKPIRNGTQQLELLFSRLQRLNHPEVQTTFSSLLPTEFLRQSWDQFSAQSGASAGIRLGAADPRGTTESVRYFGTHAVDPLTGEGGVSPTQVVQAQAAAIASILDLLDEALEIGDQVQAQRLQSCLGAVVSLFKENLPETMGATRLVSALNWLVEQPLNNGPSDELASIRLSAHQLLAKLG